MTIKFVKLYWEFLYFNKQRTLTQGRMMTTVWNVHLVPLKTPVCQATRQPLQAIFFAGPSVQYSEVTVLVRHLGLPPHPSTPDCRTLVGFHLYTFLLLLEEFLPSATVKSFTNLSSFNNYFSPFLIFFCASFLLTKKDAKHFAFYSHS